jgi:hypothetical protein
VPRAALRFGNLFTVIPGRAKREPGISRNNLEIPGLALRAIPE